MSTSILGLPPVPPELKPITPFLQRAEELVKQDKIMSYWCAYYAAQVGISLKARGPQPRDFLFGLLNTLETMKSDIGANDAIDIESVSAAYVENFALKVFVNADNEDRNSRATRSTAKKFLAASNFLEALKTFPKTDVSEANEDKIRYSKWKAADIAKAFREGRKPAPGPPGWAEEQEELKRMLQEQEERETPSAPSFFPTVPSGPTSSSPPRSSHIDTSQHYASSSSPPKRSPTRPDHLVNVDRFPPGWATAGDGPPESWSTTSTPGVDPPATGGSVYTIGTTPSTAGYGFNPDSPTRSGGRSSDVWTHDGAPKPRRGSESSTNTVGSNGSRGGLKKSSFKSPSPDSDKRVHFSESTAGSPPPPPPPHLPLSSSPPKQYNGPSSIYAPPAQPVSPPMVVYPTNPSPTYPVVSSPPSIPASSSPPRQYIYAPSPPKQASPTHAPAIYAPPRPPVPEVELTPGLITKAQKHCRFAISALDYEDAEQARKELRAALALLGG